MLHVQAENVWWRILDHTNIIWPTLITTQVFLVVPEYVISGDGLSGSEEKMQREVAQVAGEMHSSATLRHHRLASNIRKTYVLATASRVRFRALH